MPADTETAVAIAQLEARVASWEHRVAAWERRADERIDEILRVTKDTANELREMKELGIRKDADVEHEIAKVSESGERTAALLDAVEARVRKLEAERDKDAGRAEATGNTGPNTALVAAHTDESRARSGLWKVLSTFFGAIGGALTTWLATKR